MQRRRMPRNAKRASGAVVCAVALLSGCSGHPLADTAREALQAVTAGEALPAPLARAYLLLGLSLALNAVMLLCWAGGQLARLGRLVRRMSARQKKEIVVKVEQMAPNRSTVLRPCRKHRSSFRSRKQKYGRKNRNGDPAGRKRDRP